MDLKEEEELVRAAKKIKEGTNIPFGKLYEAYEPKIKKFFLARSNDETLAQDLTSKAFIKALDGLDSYQWQGLPFSSWLFRIARNIFFDHLRSTRGKTTLSFDETIQPKGESEVPAFEQLAHADEEEWLAHLLFTLQPREREIIYLKFYEGLTNRAIAKVTKLSETNVGTILYRTLKRLRNDLRSQRT